MKNVEKDVVLNEVFKERIIKSNIFNKKEQETIEKNYLLFKKCYCLGILDKKISSDNYAS